MEKYHNDSPILASEEDRFHRAPFAKKIASIIATRDETSCLTIGIFGKWGEGKTSVLNLIEADLILHNIITIRYNPWRYTGEEQLLSGFYYKLAEALQKKLTSKKEDIGGFIEKYLKPAAEVAGYGGAAQSIASLLGKADLEELRDRISAVLDQHNTKLVVFIDDIDRLDKVELSSIFRLVKLNADFSNTVYVLSFDDEAVAHAIGEQYGSDSQAGRSFLEKIIQVPLHLPEIPQYLLSEFCFDELRKILADNQISLKGEESRRFSEGYWNGLEPMLTTPRLARLYGNVLRFSIPLLKDEVNVVDLMLIDGIKVFYPKIHAVIHRNAYLFLGDSNYYGVVEFQDQRQNLNNILTKNTDLQGEKAIKGLNILLAVLFPNAQPLLYTGRIEHSVGMEELANQQRAGSWEYFQRYFSYAISSIDISDQEIHNILMGAHKYSGEEMTQKFRSIVMDDRKAKSLISKLARNTDYLDGNPKNAQILAQAVALCGNYWSTEENVFSYHSTPFFLAVRFISDCVRSIQNVDIKASLLLQIVNEPVYLPFAIECSRIGEYDGTEDSEEKFSDSETAVIARISLESKSVNLIEKYGIENAITIFLSWRMKEPNEVSEYITHLLESIPSMGSELVKGIVIRRTKYTLSDRQLLDKEGYNLLVKLIKPSVVLGAIERNIGSKSTFFKFNGFEPTEHFPKSLGDKFEEHFLGEQLAWHINNPDSTESDSS